VRVVVTRAARRDLQEAYDYAATDNPFAASRLIDDLVSHFLRIASGELKGPEVLLSDGRTASYWVRPPFRIYYRVRGARLTIVRVYHQARKPIEQ
jgi:plasmid stabilization system protein ParE